MSQWEKIKQNQLAAEAELKSLGWTVSADSVYTPPPYLLKKATAARGSLTSSANDTLSPAEATIDLQNANTSAEIFAAIGAGATSATGHEKAVELHLQVRTTCLKNCLSFSTAQTILKYSKFI